MRSGWLDELTLETVIVHVDDGPSVKGVKQAVHADCIVLRDSYVYGEDDVNVLAGEIVIPRERVLFLQVVAAEEGKA